MIPKDVYAVILKELDFKDICNCLTLDKYTNSVIEEKGIWKRLCERDYSSLSEYWKRDYKETYKFCTLLQVLHNKLGLNEICLMKYFITTTVLYRNLDRIPKNMNLLSNLEIISFNGGTIKDIPDDMCSLPNLIVLNLRDNAIVALPSSLSNLIKLKNLNLECNLIEDITNICKIKSLEFLSLHNNMIENIPKEIVLLENLDFLDLTLNNIEEIPTLPPLLTTFKLGLFKK